MCDSQVHRKSIINKHLIDIFKFGIEYHLWCWLVGWLGFTACQPLLGYLMPNIFCFIYSCCVFFCFSNSIFGGPDYHTHQLVKFLFFNFFFLLSMDYYRLLTNLSDWKIFFKKLIIFRVFRGEICILVNLYVFSGN